MPSPSTPAAPAAPRRDYDALLKRKLAAGLPLADAKEVIARQKARDKKLDDATAAQAAADVAVAAAKKAAAAAE